MTSEWNVDYENTDYGKEIDTKIWDPTAQASHGESTNKTYEEMLDKFGEQLANDCQGFTDDDEEYPKQLIHILHLVASGKVSIADFEEKGVGVIEERKKKYHLDKKFGGKHDSIADAAVSRAMDEDEYDPLAKTEIKIHTGFTGKLDIENGLVQSGKLFKLLPTHSELIVYLYLNATKITKPLKNDPMNINKLFLACGKIVSTAKLETICEKTGLHKDSVIDAMNRLEKRDAIKRVKIPMKKLANRKATILANILDNGKMMLLLETVECE